MSINYNDSRFTQIEQDKQNAINKTTSIYDDMINSTVGEYQKQIDATNKYEEIQKQNQQAQTDLQIEEINQKKAQAKQDYINEQKGAYTDYQKAIDEYGANAEKIASSGLKNSGYSESSRISAFTSYQNRYATSRKSYNEAVLNYDNSINEAKLANSSALAQIAYNALEKRLSAMLDSFQYKNGLIKDKLAALNDVEDRYYTRYKDVVDQINAEKELEEKQREFNLTYAKSRKKSSSSSSSGSLTSGSSSSGTTSDRVKQIAASLTSFYSNAPLSSKLDKSTLLKNNINRQFQSGKINADEVKQLTSYFGL